MAAFTLRRFVSSPRPNIFNPSFSILLMILICLRSSAVTVVPSSSLLRSAMFITVYSLAKMLVNPRLGSRRARGIWPPSKPFFLLPLLAFWPLWPLAEVLPSPEPVPRPTRFSEKVDPSAGLNSCSFMLHLQLYLFDLYKVLNLEDHAADAGIVGLYYG